MAIFTANATASLTASGTTTATGSITWAAPSLPDGVSAWDSVVISGTWSWGGKGSISRVTINGTNTTGYIPFEIDLGVNAAPPLTITCVGNKNATGSNFTWSNLIVTYTYTEVAGEQFMIKQNGIWTNVQTVYKKINGVWVEQSDLASIFNEDTKYVQGYGGEVIPPEQGKYTVTITGSGHVARAYVEINGTNYTSPGTYQVDAGTVIRVYVGSLSDAEPDAETPFIVVDGITVQEEAGSYNYTVNKDCTIDLCYSASGCGGATITTV